MLNLGSILVSSALALPDPWQYCCAQFTHWKETCDRCTELTCLRGWCWDNACIIYIDCQTQDWQWYICGSRWSITRWHTHHLPFLHEESHGLLLCDPLNVLASCSINVNTGGLIIVYSVLLDRAKPLGSRKRVRYCNTSPVIRGCIAFCCFMGVLILWWLQGLLLQCLKLSPCAIGSVS